MRLGLKKKDLDQSFGIHPTTAEEFLNMEVTKESGLDFEKESC